jgi:hypothetical protein
VLPTGDVFVIGGVDGTGNPTDSTFVINAAGITAGPRLASPRVGHSATVLASGQVFVAGGRSDAKGTNVLDSTEIYDPLARTFAPGPKLTAKRTDHVAVSIGPAGAERILIASGATNAGAGLVPLASAELLDTVSMTSAPIAAKMNQARAGALAAKLDNGTVLIVSGETGQGPAGAEVFDPTAQTFALVTASIVRSGAALAATGPEASIVGGQSSTGVEGSTDVYTMASRTIATGPRIATARRDAVALRTPSGVVITGGRDAAAKTVASVEVLAGTSLSASTLRAAQPLVTARWGHSANVLSNGLVLVVGGFDASGVPVASIEIVDPTTTTAATPSSAPATTAPSATTGSTGSSGGSIFSSILNAAVGALSNNTGGGVGGFFQAFIGNLLNNLLGGTGAAGSGTAGASSGNIFTSILGSILGGNAPGNSSAAPPAPSAPAPSTGSSATSSSGGFFSTILSFITSLFGGSSSSSAPSSNPSPSNGGAQVLTVLPTSGMVGDTVTLVGMNWGSTAEVLFNGVSTGQVPVTTNGSAVQVVVQVPAGATTGPLVINTNGVSLGAGTFTVH